LRRFAKTKPQGLNVPGKIPKELSQVMEEDANEQMKVAVLYGA
jgi:hypothetical protein